MPRIRETSETATRAVGYLRRSTDRQEQSIADQQAAVASYAEACGLQLVDCYIDDAISGTSAAGRRAFQQMVADAQRDNRPFDAVIVYDVKRFGRVDNDEAGYYRYLLRRHGVEVRYVSEDFGHEGDGIDDLLRPVKQWQARQESKDLAKVTIRGLLSKMETRDGDAETGEAAHAQAGWWMGGCPPFGYDLRYESADGAFLFVVRYQPDGSKELFDADGELTRTLSRRESINVSKRDRCALIPSHPDRVAAVQWMFRLYADEGRGVRAVAGALNEAGVPTPRGPAWSRVYSGQWASPTVRAILVNPIYVGDMAWNRRRDGRFYRIAQGAAVDRGEVHGARLVPNDENDWMLVRDAHEALVSRDLFERVQQRMRTRARKPRKGEADSAPTFRRWHGRRGRYILSGLLACARCGGHYQGVTRTKGKPRADGSRVKTRYYACGGYVNRGRSVCRFGAIHQKRLESAVIEAVLAYYAPYRAADGRDRLARAVRAELGTEREDLAAARERIEKERSELKAKVDNLLDNLTETNREFVDERLAELKDRQQELERRSEQLERLELDQQRVESTTDEAMAVIEGLEATFRDAVPEQQQAALRAGLAGVAVDPEAGRVELTFRPVPLARFERTETVTADLAAAGENDGRSGGHRDTEAG